MTDQMTLLADLPPSISGSSDTPVEPLVLVVDDSVLSRRVVCSLVEKNGYKAASAKHGREALDFIKRQEPAIVVTDLHMPEMDGLELVEELRSDYPHIPVILMTACGSEKIAIEALRRGAASYVTKDSIADDLPDTLETVLQAAKVDRRRQEFLESVTDLECRFALVNDPAQVPVLIAHVQDYLTRMRLCDTNQRIRVGTALEEALLNGLYHGNLELSSELRQDGGDTYECLGAVRRNQAPYRERRLHIHVRLNLSEAVFAIRDEGPGFDVSKLPDPTDPENMTRVGGRGLLLIRTFMDEAIHNATGNQLTLTWRRKAAPTRRR